MASQHRLSANSAPVLRLMAEGRSYAQIVASSHDLTYRDIFRAAEEALRLLSLASASTTRPVPRASAAVEVGGADRLTIIRRAHPKAYEPWRKDEEDALIEMYNSGINPAEIARRLQRQPGAIESRLRRLGLGAPPAPGQAGASRAPRGPRSGDLSEG